MITASTPTPPLRKRVLFVGDDAGSTQIAASLLHRVVGDRVEVCTAGTHAADPGGRSDEMLVAMGLNPADEQRLSAGTLHRADRVIILGTGLDVARLPGPRYEEWNISDDDLAEQVRKLGDELTTVPAPRPRSAALGRLRGWLESGQRR